MKKIATLILIVTLTILCTVPVFATESHYPHHPHSDQARWSTDQEFKEWEERFERRTARWYREHNVLLSWYIKSMHNHRHVKAMTFPWKETVYELHTSKVDFIEFGKLFESKTEDEIEIVRQDFIENPVDAALKFIIPIPASESEDFEEYTADLRQEIEEKKIPVYWNIKTMTWDPEFYTIEVAIGKYVIKEGDTLTGIAEQFNTSVEELLRKNYNIKDQNHIEAGNYLCIW